MAKNYIDNLSEETRKGMLEKAEQGIYPSFAPLGYTNVDSKGKRHIQPTRLLRPLIRVLYEWYASGNYSLLEVTKKARAEGLTYRKTGAKLHKSIVHKILTNPIYYGDSTGQGDVIEGPTSRSFLRNSLIMSKKSWLRRVGGGPVSKNITGHSRVSSLVAIAVVALTGEIKKGRYVYYHCTGHKGKCPERYVREEELDRGFTEALRAIKIDKEVLEC